MLSNFKGSGEQLTVTLGSGETGYAVGDPYLIGGTLLGVITSLTRDGQTVMNNVASAEDDVAIVVIKGVFSVPKATGAVDQGDRLYWDVSEDEVTTTSSGNIFAGFAHAAAAENAATVDILLVNGDSAGANVAANVTVISTADGSDAGTTQTLANATKAKVNSLITALVNAGIMTAP